MTNGKADGAWDYVIVGAGSAGCVLANRLGEDADARILLLEAGPRDRHWSIHMPAGVGELLSGDRFNWFYRSAPEPHLGGRRLNQPRGRVLGGSSSINGMVYVRGHAGDYDGWAADGCTGWSYAEVLPYFRRSETYQGGGDAYRGDSGPLHVARGEVENPLCRAFVAAGEQAGYARTDDVNGYRQEGFGAIDRTTHEGRRWSTARGYLEPALARGNVDVVTGALARRVVFEGERAVGIEYEAGGAVRTARADREVILAAGAVNTPHLLMLSGVGRPDDLEAHGIAVRHALPGVGHNLADHPDIVLQYACTRPVSIYPWTKAPAKWLVGLQWFLTHQGLAATNHFDTGAFIRSAAGIEHPDLQLTFMPLAVQPGSTDSVPRHAFQVHVDLMRPTSMGRIVLRSADPRDKPDMVFNYLETEEDRAALRASVRLVREIIEQPAYDDLRGDELLPGPAVQSDDAIDAFVRGNVETGYHAAGTCRMGPAGNPESVVDPATLAVHGLSGLRVVDASVMPRLVSGNTNGPTIMVAEKASDIIRNRAPEPPSAAPVWIHPDWRSAQR